MTDDTITSTADTSAGTTSATTRADARLVAEEAAGGSIVAVDLTVNGDVHRLTVEARRTLSDVIRHDCGLTGTHVGCEHGVCGACTVMVDGEPARSCLLLAAQVDGADITTIEGLAADDGTPHPIQQAMMDAHGFQCAFCAPGFLMSTLSLLDEHPDAIEADIREELSGNICRCTGYQSIVDGVLRALGDRPGSTDGEEAS